MKKYLPFFFAFSVLTSCFNGEKKSSVSDKDNNLINVFLADESSKEFSEGSIKKWKTNLLRIRQSFVIENKDINIHLHKLTPVCGGCSDYKLLHITGSDKKDYMFPLNDEYYYSSKGKYGDLKLERALNYFFYSEPAFSDFSFEEENDISMLNSFLSIVVDSIIINDSNSRIHLIDTSYLTQRIIKYQKLKELNDPLILIDSASIKKAETEINDILKDLKSKSRHTFYYNYYGGIYKLSFSALNGYLRVNVNLLNKELFSRFII